MINSVLVLSIDTMRCGGSWTHWVFSHSQINSYGITYRKSSNVGMTALLFLTIVVGFAKITCDIGSGPIFGPRGTSHCCGTLVHDGASGTSI
jgi:hypothetical protein